MILDCTLRDGGYYTNWDFSSEFIRNYIDTINLTPIKYAEIGYIGFNQKSYRGEFYFLTPEKIINLRKSLNSSIKISVMIDFKDIKDIKDYENLNIKNYASIVDLIRVAINIEDFKKSQSFFEHCKRLGFHTALNLMRSTENDLNQIKHQLSNVNVDYFYIVDSNGSLFPENVKKIIQSLRSSFTKKIGFHGHNNLELAFANSIVAMKEGVDVIDGTFTGMGRGAGNTKTESLLFKTNGITDRSLPKIYRFLEYLEKQKALLKWGPSFPYLFSGFHNLPQGPIMELIQKNRLNYISMINRFQENSNSHPKVSLNGPTLILGNGSSYSIVESHVHKFINVFNITNVIVLNKNFKQHKNLAARIIITEDLAQKNLLKSYKYVLCLTKPATYGGSGIKMNIYNIKEANLFEQVFKGFKLEDQSVYLIGFDGYPNNSVLQKENQTIINNNIGKINCSLTPTSYDNVPVKSIFDYLKNG